MQITSSKASPIYAVKTFFGIAVSWLRFPSPGGVSAVGPQHGLQANLGVHMSPRRNV